MTSVQSLLWLYLPMWGAEFDSNQAGLVGGNVLASIPYANEWDNIQQTEVVHERLRLAQGVSPPPPLCLSVLEPRLAGESLAESIHRLGHHMLAQGRTAILALRLHKPGWFLEPELAEICFANTDHGWELQRIPGPYRQSFLAGLDGLPFPGYQLAMSELSLPGQEPGAVTKLWDQLSLMRTAGSHAAIEIALENFNRSYGFILQPSQRLAHLFVSLDALCGGYANKNPGGLLLKGAGSSFTSRIKAAMLLDGCAFITANQRAAWLKDKDHPGDGRWLRNRIAHGDDVDTIGELVEEQLRLQAIVRSVLRVHLQFLSAWQHQEAALRKNLALPDQCSPVGAFNALLAAHVLDPSITLTTLPG